MQVLRQFSIPFRGLSEGSHKFEYELDKAFFSVYEDSPLMGADVNVILDLNKRMDHMTLDFQGEGKIQTECDRCTADIKLPFSFKSHFIVKFDEDEREEEEVVYIHPESHHLEIADLLHEQLILALPMIRTYDCEDEDPQPCNTKVLEILNSERKSESGSSLGEALKNLKITKQK